MSMQTTTRSDGSEKTVRRTDRWRWLLGARLTIVAASFAGWAAVGSPAPLSLLLLPAAGVVAAGLGLHLLAAHGPGWASVGVPLALVLDALYLGWALYLAGGLSGPVAELVVLHVAAVVLLDSLRNGLRLAVAHSLVVMTVLETVGTGLLVTRPGVAGLDEPRFGFFLAAVWGATVLSGALAAANEREVRRRRYDEVALRRCAVALTEAGSAGQVAAALLDLVVDVADASVAGVSCRLADPDGGPATELSARRRSGAAVERLAGTAAPAPGSLLEAAARDGGVVFAEMHGPDVWVDEVLDGARRVVAVPFESLGQVSGVLAFAPGAGAGARAEQRGVAAVQLAVAHAATALARVALSERTPSAGGTDGAGARDARALDEALDREVAAASATTSALAVMLVGLDPVEEWDGTPSSCIGDEVFRFVEAELRGCVRLEDVVARRSGDVFAVVLPGGTVSDALAVAGRFREALLRVPSPRPVTAGVGIASWPHHGRTRESLLAAAEQALFAARAGGRDQVRLAGRPRDRAESAAG